MANNYISQFSRGEALLDLLGTFWQRNFNSRSELRHYNLGLAQIHGHNYIKILESIATLSRFKIPVFSESLWEVITIRDSDRTSAVLTYGDGTLYGDPVVYGGPSVSPSNTFKLRYALSEVSGCLMDRPINPQKVWLPDSIQIENKQITFLTDPFTEITTGRTIVDDLGNAVDTELDLFVYRGGYDLKLVYEHFGYVLGIKMASSEFFKDLLNVLWTGYNDGFSVANLFEVLDIIVGIPRAKGDEIIEQISVEGDYNVVITDKNTYSIDSSLTLLPGIIVGNSLVAFQQFTAAAEVIELSDSETDIDAISSITLPRLAFGSGWFPILTSSTISAENKVVPLVTVGMSGPNPLLEFELSGYEHDITKFWADVRAREVVLGKTLAEYLTDYYVVLPTDINPLLFILKQFLRENLIIIRLNSAGYVKLNSTKELIAELYKLVAAHTSFLVFVEEAITPEVVDTQTFTELIESAIGGEVSDSYNLTTITENLTASLEPELC
jgi:hypothetical protein